MKSIVTLFLTLVQVTSIKLKPLPVLALCMSQLYLFIYGVSNFFAKLEYTVVFEYSKNISSMCMCVLFTEQCL